ncbi:RluA family pseudouridine synthase [Helicobacter labacensis]|uniref:RluA family pseudouridine synthase n=1 Tax=Helicobacter labacensis TaxID=2316079 RepID=UPI000EB154BA|nr:RluA family pseudouridine synthase [Helicobacter labacensis]
MKEAIAPTSQRADCFVAHLAGVPRSQALQYIKAGLVCINDRACTKGGVVLKPGDCVRVLPPKCPTPPLIPPPDLDIACLYEDEDILVLNKPPHLATHPAPSLKEATLVEYLQAKGYALSNLGGVGRCGIVHRLDKQTSGALVIAKNNASHAHLSAQLANRQMGRFYVALIEGRLRAQMCVECRLGRHPKNRLKMANLDALKAKGGKPSKSVFIPLVEGRAHQLIGARLHSGRTHQVRVHLQSVGRYILGDTLYGRKDSPIARTMLHAYLLYLIHPKKGQALLFKAKLLDDMVECAHKLFQGVDWHGCLQEDMFLGRFGIAISELRYPQKEQHSLLC